MQLVVAERFFPEPVGPERLAELRRRNAWCRDLHGVRPVRALAAPGQQRYLCLYEAPDAEAVRHYSRAAGTPLERAWPATLFPGSVPPDRPLPDDVFVVERLFETPLSVAALEEKEARLSPCLESYCVRRLQSYLARDGRRLVCIYDAPDAESVRQIQRSASLAYERLWRAFVSEAAAQQPTLR